MVTLHAYVLRELLKSFGLTVLALTALFTMGGGLYNILKVEGVTTGDLFTVLPILIPVSATITMPVAALFAATMVYGRLAADNELVACRAAGINVHRLFLSVVLLSAFVACSTAIAWNVLFPSCMLQIERLVRGNVRNLAFHRLRQRGYIEYGKTGTQKYMLTAEAVLSVPAEQLVEKGFDPPTADISYFWVEHPTFLMIDRSGELERFSVAEGGLCQFHTRERDIEFTLYVKNARDYEVGKGAGVVQVDEQKIGPYAREIPFSPKPSMVRLQTLWEWLAAPWKAPRIATRVDKFLGLLRCHVFYTDTAKQLNNGEALVLHDLDDIRYEIHVQSCTGRRKELVFNGVTITQHKAPRGAGRFAPPPTRYEAPLAKLRARPLEDGETLVELELKATPDQPVLEYNPRAGDYGTPREKESLRLSGLRLPQYVHDRMQTYTPAAVLDTAAKLPTNVELEDQRNGLHAAAEKLRRKVNGVIHFRFGLAASALVTILMGAMLGVIFRGARALAAFGLACIPLGIALILIAMGKQITESEATGAVGPYVIWGGLTLVGLADGLILRFGVRR